jgi:hypothetical protein
MVGTFAGDGFNPSGLLMSTQMSYKRIPKMILLVASIYMCAYGLKAAESKGLQLKLAPDPCFDKRPACLGRDRLAFSQKTPTYIQDKETLPWPCSPMAAPRPAFALFLQG